MKWQRNRQRKCEIKFHQKFHLTYLAESQRDTNPVLVHLLDELIEDLGRAVHIEKRL